MTVLVLASAAYADDSFFYDGFRYPGTIKGLRDGRLWATVAGGEKLFDLAKVSDVRLEGNPKFNDAEAARASDAKKAAALYKEAIRAINDPALKQLAQLRAIDPTDADGRYTEALAYLLDVYAASPTDPVWAARPKRLPAAGSSMLKESSDRIAAALPRVKSEEAKKNLKNLQLDILNAAGDTQAANRLARELATGIVEEAAPPPRPADPASQTTAALAEVQAALQAKDYSKVLNGTDALLAGAAGEQAVQLWQLQAKAYEEQNQLDLATATLLRVVAHYPSSPSAPAALLQAADLQKRANHPAAARALLAEIVTSYPDSREAAAARTP